MQKVIVKKVKARPPLRGCNLFSWRFTRDEREAFEAVLEKYPAEKVSLFIADMEKLCLWSRLYDKERNVTFQRTEKQRMLRRFEKTREELLALVDRKVIAQESKGILEIGIVSDETVFLEDRLYWLMNATAMQLKEIVSIINNDPGEPGRPKAEDATGGLVFAIADRFKFHLEQPTAYRQGIFFAVIELALEACGLPIKDPMRHVKAALDRL